MEPDTSKSCGGCKDQLDLRKVRGLTENIDITLGELSVTTTLGTVGTPYIADLQRLEGCRQVIGIIRIESGEGKGQVVTHTIIHNLCFCLCLGNMELLTTL